MNADQGVLSAVISAFLFRGLTVCPNASLNCLASASSEGTCCLCLPSTALGGSKHTRQQRAERTAKKRIPYRTYGSALERDAANEGC